MILYDIRCEQNHYFEGWFNNSDSFVEQHSAKLIECPVCGTCEVERMLSAPAIVPARSKAVAPRQKQDIEKSKKEDEESYRFMRKVRQYVEKNCEYVGNEFPEKAREIHYGEKKPEKGVYGEATFEETKDLQDEGIQLAILPWGRGDA